MERHSKRIARSGAFVVSRTFGRSPDDWRIGMHRSFLPLGTEGWRRKQKRNNAYIVSHALIIGAPSAPRAVAGGLGRR